MPLILLKMKFHSSIYIYSYVYTMHNNYKSWISIIDARYSKWPSTNYCSSSWLLIPLLLFSLSKCRGSFCLFCMDGLACAPFCHTSKILREISQSILGPCFGGLGSRDLLGSKSFLLLCMAHRLISFCMGCATCGIISKSNIHLALNTWEPSFQLIRVIVFFVLLLFILLLRLLVGIQS